MKPEIAMKSGRIFEDEDGKVLDERDPGHGHDHVSEEAVLQDHEGWAESCSKRSNEIKEDIERNVDTVLVS